MFAEEKMTKKEWLKFYPEQIKENRKLSILKVMLDISESKTNFISFGNYKKLTLMAGKNFLDEHSSGSKEDAELIWRFCKGKLKNEK